MNKSRKAVIFGTGSFAEIVHYFLERDSDYEVVAFAVTESSVQQAEYRRLPTILFEDVKKKYPPDQFEMFIAIGYARMNQVRERFFTEAKEKGYRLLTYISSKATYWGENDIGENVFIFEDNTIQPFVTVGDDVIMWSGNHVGHRATIGPHCFLTSHVVISGHCKVGARCFFGVNATIADDITIADDNLIGPGALIQKDTGPSEVYMAERAKKFPKGSGSFFRW